MSPASEAYSPDSHPWTVMGNVPIAEFRRVYQQIGRICMASIKRSAQTAAP